MPSDDHSSDDFEVIDRQEASLDPEALAKVRAWLQPTDYEAESSEFRRHLASQAPGTGFWISETARYREWHDTDKHASLWIKGVPGAGKSVTAASIAAHLAKTEKAPVLTFFFRYIVLMNRTPRGLVRDWLAQLLPSSVKLQATIAPLVSSQLEDVTDDQLWQYLLVGLYDVDKAYCIVDALDEMDIKADHRFLTRLNDLANFRPGAVKVLMTSRPKQYLQSALPSNSIVHISLEKDLVGRDIATYISRRLEEAMPASEAELFRQDMVRAMLERCNGLFLYARLLLDQIIPTLDPTTLSKAKDVVSSLPVGLEEMYNSMLRHQARAMDVETDLQKFLLEMATHSVRPLRLNELAQALLGSYPHLGTSRAKAIARTACSPLLEILEDETVQVIHHSLTEFLLDKNRLERPAKIAAGHFPVLIPAQAHRRLCITCVQCLQSSLATIPTEKESDFDRDHRKVEEIEAVEEKNVQAGATTLAFDFQNAKLQFPLLDYAAFNWAYHASNYDVHEESFFNFLIAFIQPTNDTFRRWLTVGWARSRPNADVPSVVHVAAFAGLTQLAKTLDLANCVKSTDGGDRTPLSWASRRGHTEIATLLLKSGADPMAEDFDGIQPIHEAAKKNHFQVAELLLHAGVSPLALKSREDYGWKPRGGCRLTKDETPLEYVCSSGHVETLSMMIPYLSSDSLEEALCRSCWAGRSESVRNLLENSQVSPDATWRHGTALFLAVISLDVTCVELLLKHGANVHLFSAFQGPRKILGPEPRKENPSPPLHVLFRRWRVEKLGACRTILDLLLRSGAKTDALDAQGNSPLLEPYPCQSHERTYLDRTAVHALLETGTRFRDTDDDSILCRCIEATWDVAVLQMLLDHGYNLYNRGRGGNTVLHAAFSDASHRYGSKQPNTAEEVVNFLLEHGLGPDIKNSSGKTALEAAASSRGCSYKMFRRLFESCSDNKARDNCIWALETNRDEKSAVQFLELLLDAGVSLEVRNSLGQTPLLAKLGTYEWVPDTLIKYGARVDAVDNTGRGVLHHYIAAVSCRRSDPMPRFHKLLAMTQNVAFLDGNQNSLLHELALYWKPQSAYGSDGHVELARFLMAQGLDPNARNSLGQTVFHRYLDKMVYGSPQDNGSGISTMLRVLRESRVEFELDARDGNGLTALHFMAGHMEWGFFHLLEVGADPFIRTSDQRTVLHIASRAGKTNIVGHILDVAAELLDAKDTLGRTALHDACSEAHFETAYYLIQHGASLMHKDNLGRTALHTCAESNTDRSIPKRRKRSLRGSGPRSSDDHRAPPRSTPNTPWYRCSYITSRIDNEAGSSNVAEIVGMLVEAGADVKAKDNHEHTPLDLALAFGCSSMARALAARFPETGALTSCEKEEHKAQVTAELAFHCRPPLPFEELPMHVRQEILDHPRLYFSSLNESDLKYIVSTGVGLSGPKSGFSNSSLLQDLAKSGQIDKIRQLGSLAKEFDNQEYVNAIIHGQSTKSYYWDEYRPPLLAACTRAQPNMAMLKLLVEFHGLDVNARGYARPDGHLRDAGPLLDGTALHNLAEAHSWWQLDAIRYLVKHGAHIDARNARGNTPLHIACGIDGADQPIINTWKPCMWRTDCIRLLISLGADVNAVDNEGCTALHKAGRDANAVRVLLEHGASLTCGGSSPFFSAIAKQNAESVGIMLKAGVSPDTVDMDNSCPIWYTVEKNLKRYAFLCACFQGDWNRQDKNSVGMVQLLIEHGADLYAPLSEDETLLHYIFQNASYCIVKAIVEQAARIDFAARDQRGRTIFHAACDWWQTLPGYRHEHWSAKEPAPIRLILQANPDINLRAVDHDDKTVLHHLADNPNQEEPEVLDFLQHPVCKELLHLRDRHGYTPLQYALRALRPAIVNALLDLGADLLAPDPTGATAAHHIARQYLRGHNPQGKQLLQPDRDPDFQPACAALWKQYLARGGDLEARDRHGNTPLLVFLASEATTRYDGDRNLGATCHMDHYHTLFADADVHARNTDLEGALHTIARRKGTGEHDAALFEFMVGKGLVPLVEDARSRSALDMAAACGNTKILELYQYRS